MREIRTSGSVGALGGKPPRATRPLIDEHDRLDLDIDEDTLELWGGESMDYGWAIHSLLRRDQPQDDEQWVPVPG